VMMMMMMMMVVVVVVMVVLVMMMVLIIVMMRVVIVIFSHCHRLFFRDSGVCRVLVLYAQNLLSIRDRLQQVCSGPAARR
jgi:hypothetical protein